ncbi:hypothetical protein [Maridesulfovibrio sp. FT414]|uniref:hypothetical protein n=1 Tax=Maridesulfovibrio sp. FT414 TaxID=2979469 RepID=UPI003D808C77
MNTPITCFPQHDSSKQFLQESSDIMYQYAKKNCLNNHTCDCFWYHSSWQYLRLFGGVHSQELHFNSYKDFFTQNRHNDLNILISGTADYAILHHLHPFLISHSNKIQIYIIDICTTPLKICQWYVDRLQLPDNITFTTIREDIFRCSLPNNFFNLITSYSFISRFKHVQQKEIIEIWKKLLNKYGSIITSDRVMQRERYDTAFKESNLDKKKFVEKIMTRYNQKGIKLSITKATLAAMAYKYIDQIRTYSIASDLQFKNLFFPLKTTHETKLIRGEASTPWIYTSIMASNSNHTS